MNFSILKKRRDFGNTLRICFKGGINIDSILFKKWSAISGGNASLRIPSRKIRKKQKNGKNNGGNNALDFSNKEMPAREVHHVWPKPFRNNRGICEKNNIKNVNSEEHDVWNKFAGEAHPKIVFGRIINLCIGKIKASEDEKKHLAILAGFNWQKNPEAAIVAIFDKFMPNELGEMIVPYLNRIK